MKDNNREKALAWWNELPHEVKQKFTIKHFQGIRPIDLFPKSIAFIYNAEHPQPSNEEKKEWIKPEIKVLENVPIEHMQELAGQSIKEAIKTHEELRLSLQPSNVVVEEQRLDYDLIADALNCYWHDANSNLSRKDLGTLEERNYRKQEEKCRKEILKLDRYPQPSSTQSNELIKALVTSLKVFMGDTCSESDYITAESLIEKANNYLNNIKS